MIAAGSRRVWNPGAALGGAFEELRPCSSESASCIEAGGRSGVPHEK